ncbi:MAG: VCBS repeat-containing protein, partial [Verrucomicrobia bacterium]|nr:VCBS repeat-containing protein [Verrucomicrobiota bacterium]
LGPDEINLAFENLLRPENIINYLYNGAGGCVGDYDGDGLPDLYLISQDGPNRLFRQTSSWRFEDVTDKAGVDGGEAWGSGATFVDIDNDGDLDLYVCNMGSPNLLYINEGQGGFREAAAEYGLDFDGASWMASFSDYDRDGDLDCYLLTYRLRYIGLNDPKFEYEVEKGRFVVPLKHAKEYYFLNNLPQEAGRRDHLYQNQGNGAFLDVSEKAGIGGVMNHGLSATWWDYNNDNWPDLYVASDFKDPDRLWRNNGDGTFTDVLPQKTTYTSWFAMGSDFGDLNRDGWFDYFVGDMSAMNHYRQKMGMGAMSDDAWFLNLAEPRQFMRNMVYLNAGGHRFLESGYLSGLESTGWTWGTRFADLDCDGWEDVIISNGMARDVNNADFVEKVNQLNKSGEFKEREHLLLTDNKPGDNRNKVFRNRGDLSFEDVSEAWGYHAMSASFGLILADLDRDGDLDVVTNNMNQPVSVYRNDLKSGHRVLIELRGRQSNSFGVGSRLRLKSASGWQTRMLSLARGYESGSEPVIHFGLGKDELIEKLEIDWPSGAKQVLKNLAVDQRYVITEPEGEFKTEPARPEPESRRTLFSMDAVPGLEFQHRESFFDDYEREPLLPWKLSRLGPGLAFGDVDGDGKEDLWVGGAKGQSGAVMMQKDTGRWIATFGGALSKEKDRDSEDMGAIFFDPDGDGDMDLYIASGGNEFTAGESIELEDRLYINLGKKGLARAGSDPKETVFVSSGVVAAADYDRDGDVDLFVGTRVNPGKFHEVPFQRLLRNEGDHITDVINEVAPELKLAGMVTSALWSDVDADGRLDLLITTTWGPVRVFQQGEGGKFVETTKKAGLAEALGWWQGIAGGDVDGDGDIDYVVTNMGRNTKYHATAEKPFALYANDFDGDGIVDLLEAEYEGDTLYPVRGLSCSSGAMPFVREKFKTYDAFARADLATIYTPLKLAEARVMKFTHLDSSVLINDGEGHFEIKPLPPLAQMAPGFGVVVEDFDGDGVLDVVMAQNFYSPQAETGRMSGGLGVFLKGKGDGFFTEIWPQKSGILI